MQEHGTFLPGERTEIQPYKKPATVISAAIQASTTLVDFYEN